jgi:hypothetical protein
MITSNYRTLLALGELVRISWKPSLVVAALLYLIWAMT